MSLQQYDVAVTYLERVVDLWPNSSEAHNKLGICYANKGDIELAEFHFRRAIQVQPGNMAAIQNLKIIYNSK